MESWRTILNEAIYLSYLYHMYHNHCTAQITVVNQICDSSWGCNPKGFNQTKSVAQWSQQKLIIRAMVLQLHFFLHYTNTNYLKKRPNIYTE
jgi:hypothetical protein